MTAASSGPGAPPSPEPRPEPPAVVGVLGAGRMGAGIAQSFAAAGSSVTVVERDADAAAEAVTRVAAGLARAAERGALRQPPEEVLGRVTTIASVAGLPATAGLVVEAVPEDAALKARMLAAAERAVGPTTVLATNTSSLSVTELASALERPDRFLGMHFFNPVPASALVELVVAPGTAEDTVRAARAWTGALGKQHVVVRDSPGFVSSRLGVAMGLEAIRMVEEGVAEPEAIDDAMRLGYRHPMGPLRLTDLVGLDVRLAIAEHLHATLGARFEPPRLLRDMVERGDLGRKTGRGFYPWP
ncbi:3-hydroxyacyl-CoA dehydrogenase family protein [Streptomyces sp. B6B3]|uniref:3-hydroxyacyl-CoA dehydrogenase family protein n=1 Tax=Streptomyces sp. B6B3 TaxID=3153570 RepID=UPI00325DC717